MSGGARWRGGSTALMARGRIVTDPSVFRTSSTLRRAAVLVPGLPSRPAALASSQTKAIAEPRPLAPPWQSLPPRTALQSASEGAGGLLVAAVAAAARCHSLPSAAATSWHHAAGMGDPAERLFMAAFYGPAAAKRAALAAGADPTTISTFQTALHSAAAGGHVECVRAPLAAGASPAAADSAGWTPLALAAIGGCTEAARALAAAAPETCLIQHSGNGKYPVEWALCSGYWAVADCLLEHGPQPPAAAVLSGLESGVRRHGATEETLAPLYVLLAARQPLTPADWQQLPAPCPGLGAALPAVLARSEAEAAQLVAHLPPADKQRLRTAALCIRRVERSGGLHLPAELQRPLLLAALGARGPMSAPAVPLLLPPNPVHMPAAVAN